MALKRVKLTEDQILQKIEDRTEARKNKDYEKSDAIRKDLAVVGIALMDSPTGTSWRPAIPLPLQEQQMAATWMNSGVNFISNLYCIHFYFYFCENSYNNAWDIVWGFWTWSIVCSVQFRKEGDKTWGEISVKLWEIFVDHVMLSFFWVLSCKVIMI